MPEAFSDFSVIEPYLDLVRLSTESKHAIRIFRQVAKRFLEQQLNCRYYFFFFMNFYFISINLKFYFPLRTRWMNVFLKL